MRIALKHAGKMTWLAGQPGVGERVFSSSADLSISAEILTQQNQFIRARNAATLDRGNLATTVSWSTTRKFQTISEAEIWVADYDRVMPRTGTLVFQSLMPGGGEVRRAMDGAVIRPPQRQIIGVTVILNYTAQGGAITVATS